MASALTPSALSSAANVRRAAASESQAESSSTSAGGKPFMIEGRSVHIGASVGVACAPGDGDDPDELLRNADLALYAAKANGKATFRRYDPALDEQTRERRALEAGLRQALVEGQP